MAGSLMPAGLQSAYSWADESSLARESGAKPPHSRYLQKRKGCLLPKPVPPKIDAYGLSGIEYWALCRYQL